jgi:hypothetical protein
VGGPDQPGEPDPADPPDPGEPSDPVDDAGSADAAAQQAARRRRRERVFGEVLPESTRDDRPSGGVTSGNDRWYLENRPPHH